MCKTNTMGDDTKEINFVIKVDCREHDLIPILKSKFEHSTNIKVETESLPIGDILFLKDNKEILIIERKKTSDLASSIKDGRYKEQSFRLDGHDLHNHNIMYLVEGNLNSTRMDKTTLMSCIFSLNHYQGFSVWKTNNINETGEFLANSAKYMEKTKKDCFYHLGIETNNQEKGASTDYVNVIKSCKKENVTPENIGEIMLCQIPGVGSAAAIAIIKHFKSIVNLIADLQEHGESCLKQIEVGSVSGKTKKLNKTSISNIIKFLDVK